MITYDIGHLLTNIRFTPAEREQVDQIIISAQARTSEDNLARLMQAEATIAKFRSLIESARYTDGTRAALITELGLIA